MLISGDPEKITCIEERLFQPGGWWAMEIFEAGDFEGFFSPIFFHVLFAC